MSKAGKLKGSYAKIFKSASRWINELKPNGRVCVEIDKEFKLSAALKLSSDLGFGEFQINTITIEGTPYLYIRRIC